MDNGEILFAGNAGISGQYLVSQGAGTSPIWQDMGTSLTSLN